MFVGLAISVSGQRVSEQALVKAARYKHIEALKSILAEGVNVSAFVDLKEIVEQPEKANLVTALHQAAANGRKEMAEQLIAAGAEVNAKDKNGRTPLNWAIQFKDTEIADRLRKHGGKTGEELKAAGN